MTKTKLIKDKTKKVSINKKSVDLSKVVSKAEAMKILAGQGAKTMTIFTDEQIEKVEELSSYLTQYQIGEYFGIHRETVMNIFKRQPSALEAYRRGRTKKTLMYATLLEKRALGELPLGDTTAIIFYLKTKARWSEMLPLDGITDDLEENDEQKQIREQEIREFLEWKRLKKEGKL